MLKFGDLKVDVGVQITTRDVDTDSIVRAEGVSADIENCGEEFRQHLH